MNPKTFQGVPGLLADSLPDRFGNALIDAWLARQGRTSDSFNVVEKLCYIGSRGMGALEFAPATGPAASSSSHIEVKQLVKLASYILARNQDDHAKNIAFLMDKAGSWALSPAFDMTYSFQPTGDRTSVHQMSLNGKRDDFTLDDFKQCAKTVSMKRGRAETIIGEVREVVRRWVDYADEARVLPDHRDRIQRTQRLEPF